MEMRFETNSSRLIVAPPTFHVGCDDLLWSMFKDRFNVTVDGRPVRDVIDCDCGYLVIEFDGSESRWIK